MSWPSASWLAGLHACLDKAQLLGGAQELLSVHTGMVNFLARLENIPGLDICSRIALSMTMRYRVSKNLPRSFERPFSDIQLAPILDGLDHRHNLRSFNLGYSNFAKCREHVRPQAAPRCFHMIGAVAILPVLVPLGSDLTER